MGIGYAKYDYMKEYSELIIFCENFLLNQEGGWDLPIEPPSPVIINLIIVNPNSEEFGGGCGFCDNGINNYF